VKASSKAYDLIKKYESYRDRAYLCPAHKWTCAWGHTTGITQDTTCTLEQAEAWLRDDVAEAERAVNRLVKVPLTQNQADSILAFVYNVGVGNFTESTLLKRLNNRDDTGAKTEFGRWIFSNGKALAGLKKRRDEEAALFASD
jgi:lysozyme